MIKAKVIQDSISEQGIRITTFELEYPRFIHSEFMTHRVFSRNSASSRAIPIEKMIETIESNPAKPIHWGKNQSGMQAEKEIEDYKLWQAHQIWLSAAKDAITHSRNLANLGIHKQIANRVTEPFQWMKVVVTSTEWENFFKLRDHKDAQPEIKELAMNMKEVLSQSEPFLLYKGEWHVPYINRFRKSKKEIIYEITKEETTDKSKTIESVILTPDEAKMISASCCAQVSYRKNDDSLDKAMKVYDRLINSEPIHASPIEHQATVMSEFTDYQTRGVTHKTRSGDLFSNNFRGWIQNRALVEFN